MSKTKRKDLKESIKKKNWTVEQWKNGNDRERLIWFINSLSPHNLWKADEALKQREEELRTVNQKYKYIINVATITDLELTGFSVGYDEEDIYQSVAKNCNTLIISSNEKSIKKIRALVEKDFLHEDQKVAMITRALNLPQEIEVETYEQEVIDYIKSISKTNGRD